MSVDISQLTSAHRIVFRSYGGNDTIVGTLRPQDVIELEPGRTADEYEWEENEDGTTSVTCGVHRVTFRCEEGRRPNLCEGTVPTEPEVPTESESPRILTCRAIRSSLSSRRSGHAHDAGHPERSDPEFARASPRRPRASSITGNSRSETLRGGEGDDRIDGGRGNDKLYGRRATTAQRWRRRTTVSTAARATTAWKADAAMTSTSSTAPATG